MRERRNGYPIILCVLLCLMVALVLLAVTNISAYGETMDHLCDETGYDCADCADCEHPEAPPDDGYMLICPPEIIDSQWPDELFVAHAMRVDICGYGAYVEADLILRKRSQQRMVHLHLHGSI